MRLAHRTAASPLMASTPARTPTGGRDERHRDRSSTRRNRPARLDRLGRDRALRRPDRALRRLRRRQRAPPGRAELAQLPRLVRRHRPHVPGRGRGGRAAVPARVEGVALDRARLVLRAVRGHRPARVLRARLGPAAGGDRRARALDDEPRRRVRGPRRDRPQPRARRQAADVGDLRHGHRDGCRADDPLHQADGVDRPVRARLDRARRRPAARGDALLPPLRQPRDRAGDQARVRLPVPADVARHEGELAGRAAGVHPRARRCRPSTPPTAPSRTGCASSRSRS